MEPKTFFPESEEDVKKIIAEARQSGAHLQPYAGAYNWGYGEDHPSDPNTWKIYFNKMRKIVSFNEKLGVVRIQPGVTQKDLEDFLIEGGFNYYVPNTGAGGRGSLIGNALERGFGIAPLQDHASAMVSIRGFLADGTIYESPLLEINQTLSESFPWGVGAQLDLLASQNSLIILTEASIQLVPKAAHTDLLVANFSGAQFPTTIECLRDIVQHHQGTVGSIKIVHKNQVMNSKNSGLPAKEWFLIVTVYSNPKTRSANMRSVKSKLHESFPFVLRFNRVRLRIMRRLLSFLPGIHQLKTSLYDLSEFLRLAEGFTSEIGYKALDPNFDPQKGLPFDMSHFNKKLVWFSPLAPFESTQVQKLLDLVLEHKKTAPCEFRTLTWTVLNPRTIALVIPMVFEAHQEEKFWEFYQDLHRKLKAQGFIPYRFHNKMMKMLSEELMPRHFGRVKKIKSVLDRDDLLIPDRY